MHDPVIETQKRVQRYWYVDGISELGAGLFILLLAGSYALTGWLDQRYGSTTGQGLFLPVVVLIGYFGVRWFVRTAKQRITYPRTGYVSYPRKQTRRWLKPIWFIALSGGLSGAVIVLGKQFGMAWLPLFAGLMIALAMIWIGARIGLVRFYGLAGVVFLCGAFTAWLRLPEPFSTAAFFGLIGGVWALSGVVVLVDYLRKTKPTGEEGE